MCKEYKVIGDGFSILDIYKKRTSCQKFSEEFQALLEEEIVNKNHIHECFISYGDIKHSKVLMRNLDWLEDKGFIKEEVKDIVLKVGMKLRRISSGTDLLVVGSREDMMIISIKTSTDYTGEKYREGDALRNIFCGKRMYEVISE